MVVIRLSRAGAKKRPFYNMVVTDSRKRRDSNYIERIGYFNPIARGQEVRLHLEVEKLAHWQKVGAQLSDRVRALVKEYNKMNADKKSTETTN
jgi:small subunit ribosomal protein S16